MAFAAALPLLSAAAPSLINTFGGGGGGRSGGGGGQPLAQDSKQDVSTFTDVETNVIGAPININIGGQQQADGSLSGQRYLNRGVEEPSLYAPFGTMQGTDAQQVGFTDGWFSKPKPAIPPVVLIGGGLIVAGAGLAFLKRKR
jgi:hypothetical protein